MSLPSCKNHISSCRPQKVLGPVPKVHKLSHATPFSFTLFLILKLSKGLDSISVAVSKSGSAVVCHIVFVISGAWEMIYWDFKLLHVCYNLIKVSGKYRTSSHILSLVKWVHTPGLHLVISIHGVLFIVMLWILYLEFGKLFLVVSNSESFIYVSNLSVIFGLGNAYPHVSGIWPTTLFCPDQRQQCAVFL